MLISYMIYFTRKAERMPEALKVYTESQIKAARQLRRFGFTYEEISKVAGVN